jgi:hypothetical protein
VSSTSRRRIGVAILATALAALVGVAPTTTVGAARPLPAQLGFDVASHDFGSVTVGQTASETFTLSNAGGKGATSLAVSVSGSGMSITANGCAKALKPSASCAVTVTFAPEGAGTVTATLTASARGTSPASVALTGTGSGATADRYLYWGRTDIGRAQLDGSGADPAYVLTADTTTALDVDATHLYWTSYGDVWRKPTDGSGDPLLIVDGEQAETPGLAVTDVHVYWTVYSTAEIWRANLDGSEAQAILTGLDNPFGLDVADGFLYWDQYSGASTSKVLRLALTDLGGTPELLYEYAADATKSIERLDVAGGRVYWAHSDWNDYAGSVLSVPVGGGEVRIDVSLSAPNRIDDIAVDTEGGWLYYTVNVDDDSGQSNSSIARRLLDGTGDAGTVVSGLDMTYALAVG